MIDLASALSLPATTTVPSNIREAVLKYLQLRICEGLPHDGDTMRHLKLHLLERFCEHFGSIAPNLIQPDHLRLWEAALKHPKTGQQMSLITRRHHLIDVKTFFKRCYMERWIDHDPSRVVKLPEIDEDTPHVIPAQEAFTFFQRNREQRSVGRVALEAFGGLRYTSAGKLVLADLDFPERGITMPANKHKSGKRKFRQGHPANLWAWLQHVPESTWSVTLRQYADDKAEMFAIAGLRPFRLKTEEERTKAKLLKNVWRHSFASYLLARTKSFDTVGYLMQHSRPSTTEVYEGMARERDAHLYFAITPESVLLSWDEFVAKFSPAPQPSTPIAPK